MNKSQHMFASSLVAAGTYLTLKYSHNEKPSLKGVLFSLGSGALVGILPDVIEPANNSNHRGFFHSLTFAAILGYVLYKQHSEESIENNIKLIFWILGLAYESHLALDSITPRGLPLLTNKF
jgi:inner membrane protein